QHHAAEAREGDDRADGQIDAAAAGEDRQHRADGHDDQMGVVDQQVGQRAQLHDPAVGELPVTDHHHEDDDGRGGRQGVAVQLPSLLHHGQQALGSAGPRLLGSLHRAHTSASFFVASGAFRRRRRANRARMRSDCNRTRITITAALKAGVAEEDTPRKRTVLFSVAIKIAPTTEPPIENRPPANVAPPITTARMASSSIMYPVWETSTVITVAVEKIPATPAIRALRVYTAMSSPRGLIPAIRLAFGLIPIASIIMPSALRRITRDSTTTSTMASRNTTGRPTTYPLAIQCTGVLCAAVFCPPVMTLAMPRPAIIVIRVVMNGCSFTEDTRIPLKTPITVLSARARPTAARPTPTELELPITDRNCMHTAPETAITDPTERSMPAVAITSDIPAAIMMIGAEARRMSMRFPTRCPVSGSSEVDR